eukprot:gene3983-14061_t
MNIFAGRFTSSRCTGTTGASNCPLTCMVKPSPRPPQVPAGPPCLAPSCYFISDKSYGSGVKMSSSTEEGCSVQEVPAHRGTAPTVGDLAHEIGVSRQVAFRLQQQYGGRSVEDLKQACFQLKNVLKINIEEAGLLASKEPKLVSSTADVAKTFEVGHLFVINC